MTLLWNKPLHCIQMRCHSTFDKGATQGLQTHIRDSCKSELHSCPVVLGEHWCKGRLSLQNGIARKLRP